MSLLLALTGGGSSVTGTAATSQAQTVAADGSFTAAGIVSGSVATSQAQTASLSGSVTVPAVTGALTTSQAQTVAATGTASPATVSGTGTASQGQSSAASGSFAGSSGVSGIASTSQGQTVISIGEVINPNVGIQPIHGYNFENDRRLLKARRDKENRDKLSFIEQLEVIKPKVVKTDKQAAADFVEHITSLIPLPSAKKITDKFEYKSSNFTVLQSSGDDDEAIALLIAALL
jgi:hypothetical protein